MKQSRSIKDHQTSCKASYRSDLSAILKEYITVNQLSANYVSTSWRSCKRSSKRSRAVFLPNHDPSSRGIGSDEWFPKTIDLQKVVGRGSGSGDARPRSVLSVCFRIWIQVWWKLLLFHRWTFSHPSSLSRHRHVRPATIVVMRVQLWAMQQPHVSRDVVRPSIAVMQIAESSLSLMCTVCIPEHCYKSERCSFETNLNRNPPPYSVPPTCSRRYKILWSCKHICLQLLKIVWNNRALAWESSTSKFCSAKGKERVREWRNKTWSHKTLSCLCL